MCTTIKKNWTLEGMKNHINYHAQIALTQAANTRS